MKILFFITGLGMGGAERQVCDLATTYAELGHQVLLISLTGEVVSQPRHHQVKVINLKMAKTPFGLICAYIKARQAVSFFNPDVVHSHMVHANLFSRLLRLTVKIPKLICTAHSSNEGGQLRMLAYRFTDSLCDMSTNVSQEAVDIFVKKGAAPVNRMIPMYNGIDTDVFIYNELSRKTLRHELGLEDSTPLILAVGRLTAAKDYSNLLVAFKKLIIEGSPAQLAIIGIGEELANLNMMATDFGLNKKVHFLGLRHDVQHWMSAADLYVMSSAWEGMPLVLLEAMACERLIVATDCGGVKEVVGECGILVPPKNSEALANALSQALALTPEQASTQGRLARARIVERYSLSAQAMHWLELYR